MIAVEFQCLQEQRRTIAGSEGRDNQGESTVTAGGAAALQTVELWPRRSQRGDVIIIVLEAVVPTGQYREV